MTLLHQTDAFVQRLSGLSGAHYTVVYQFVHALIAHLLLEDEHLDGREYAFLQDFYGEDSSYSEEVEEALIRKTTEARSLESLPWFALKAIENGMSPAVFMDDLRKLITGVIDAAPTTSGARKLGTELLNCYQAQVEQVGPH